MAHIPDNSPLLTDFYQITMAYTYWRAQRTEDVAVFELYFRKNPFKGEYTVFAGLGEVLKFLENFKIGESDVQYIRQLLPDADEGFFEYLSNLTTRNLKVESLLEGSICFPKVPLLILEGPLPLLQLIETPLLNFINFATLVATNASRMRLAAPDKSLLEFGLRRAQGPNGGLTASKYCVLGGFDGTSNVLAGKLFGLHVAGTHAHSYINSFTEIHDQKATTLKSGEDLLKMSKAHLAEILKILNIATSPKESELIAFATFAATFPDSTVCLIDTYDTLGSGLPNFLAIAASLAGSGHKPRGIRIDSGDLAYISKECRKAFKKLEAHDSVKYPGFGSIVITASNNINEETLYALADQHHEIDAFGIGTHLVTCQAQPALGGVYKLVQLNGIPRMKLTEDVKKITLPGRKDAYRIFDKQGTPLVDVMTRSEEAAPKAGEKMLLRHPFIESKRAFTIPASVKKLHHVVFENGVVDKATSDETLMFKKQRAIDGIASLRQDHRRRLNPTPYKVSLSNSMYTFLHETWLSYAPIGSIV